VVRNTVTPKSLLEKHLANIFGWEFSHKHSGIVEKVPELANINIDAIDELTSPVVI
jgi:hypothetical protein